MRARVGGYIQAVHFRDGRSIIYTADYGRMTDLLAFLLEDCCEGSPNVCAPLGDVIAKAMCSPPQVRA